MRPFLWIQPAVMICSPPTFGDLAWGIGTAVVASLLMSAAVAAFLIALFRDEELSPPVTAYAVRLILSFGLMSAGLFLWAEYSSSGVFALSLVVQMTVFLHASTTPASFSPPAVPVRGEATRNALWPKWDGS
jgi:uncharacterized membrane protein